MTFNIMSFRLAKEHASIPIGLISLQRMVEMLSFPDCLID